MNKTFLLGLVCLLFVGCKTRTVTIPSGSYEDPTGKQRVIVRGKEIRFVIRLEDDNSNLFDQTYDDYSIWPNGRLLPFPITSVDAAFGVGRFDWSWDGKSIVRQKHKSQEILVFSARHEKADGNH